MQLAYLFFTVLSLTSFIETKKYILTPKYELNSFVNFEYMAIEHNLEELTTFVFDDESFLPFYIVDEDILIEFENTLTSFYEIEEDVTISLSSDQYKFFIRGNNYLFFDETDNDDDDKCDCDCDNDEDDDEDDEKEIPWHLKRISQKELPLENTYLYGESGSCHKNKDILIDSYIVDTGIDISHPQFEGRAKWGNNFVDDEDTDCNSHGTHVAGLIGSKDYGVCVDARLHAVKVLDCQGSGSLSGVIKGIQWVYQTHLKKSKKSKKQIKSIINMSLGGGYSYGLNKAVEMCLSKDQNFYIVVAAGNENSDSCNTSPASVEAALTVMASNDVDNRAYFSNWGACSDIYSPGVDIESTIPGGKTAKYSGTSMASPIVAGILNHFLDEYSNKNMTEIKKVLVEHGSKGAISNSKENTIDVLVYLNRN